MLNEDYGALMPNPVVSDGYIAVNKLMAAGGYCCGEIIASGVDHLQIGWVVICQDGVGRWPGIPSDSIGVICAEDIVIAYQPKRFNISREERPEAENDNH